MIPWQFLIFTGVMAAILYLHFFFSHLQWRRVKGEQAADVDPSYVKREDYFAQSFRSKVKSWLDLPDAIPAVAGTRIISKGSERIRVSRREQLGNHAWCDDILIVEGDFDCGTECRLSREIYAYGRAEIGSGSRLQAIAADQDLTLGDEVIVSRWVDSAGELRVGRSSVVHSRATARKVVHLEIGAETHSVFAPEIITASIAGMRGRTDLDFSAPALQIPPPIDAILGPGITGFDSSRLSLLGSDTWIYAGTLRPRISLRLAARLVVKGDCICPTGSVIEHDLKATGSLTIEEDSECRGNLIAGKALLLGPRVRFAGVIHAGGDVLLSRNVRGGTPGATFVAVYAASSLYLESDVTVRGKLSAGTQVKVVPASFAEEWRRLHESGRKRA
jgi:hypothetical protein